MLHGENKFSKLYLQTFQISPSFYLLRLQRLWCPHHTQLEVVQQGVSYWEQPGGEECTFSKCKIVWYVNEKQNKTKTEINEKKKEILKKSLTQSIMKEDSIKECGNGKLNLQSSE